MAAFNYIGKLTSDVAKVSGETYDLGDVDLGAANDYAVAVLGVFGGNFNGSKHTISVGGVACTYIVQQSGFANLLRVAVPAGGVQAVQIQVGTGGMDRAAVCIGVGYPSSPASITGSATSASGTTDAVLSNCQIESGGFIVFAASQSAALGTLSGSWSGVDPVTEHEDFQLDAAATIAFYSIDTTEDVDTNSFTLAESVSGTKQLVYASFRAPSRPSLVYPVYQQRYHHLLR